jgi:hypothetical protein
MRILEINECSECPCFAITLGGIRCRHEDNKHRIIHELPGDDHWDEWNELMKHCPTPEWCSIPLLPAIGIDDSKPDIISRTLNSCQWWAEKIIGLRSKHDGKPGTN